MADLSPTLMNVEALIGHKSKKRTVTGWRLPGPFAALAKVEVTRWRVSTGKWELIATLPAMPGQTFWSYVDTASLTDDVIRYAMRGIPLAGGREEAVLTAQAPAGVRTPPKPPVLVKAVRSAADKITLTYGSPSWAAQTIRVLIASSADAGKTWSSTSTVATVTAPAPTRSSVGNVAIAKLDHTVTVTVNPVLAYKVILQAVATNPGYPLETYGEYLANTAWSSMVGAAYTVPAAPGLVAMSEWPSDTKVRFGWTHRPTDKTAQTYAQVEYRPESGATTTLTVTGAAETVETAAALAVGDYEYRVRTRGAGGGYGDWIGWAGFSVVTRPSWAITAPAHGAVLTGNRCVATMAWSSPSGAIIRSWGARLKRGATIVEERSGTKPVTSVTFAALLDDGQSYSVEVWATGTNGINATGDTNSFTVDYLDPGAPTGVVATWDPETGTVGVTWTNAAASGGVAATVANALMVSRDNSESWQQVGDDIPGSAGAASMIDPLPPLGIPLRYRVVAISALGVRRWSVAHTPVTTRPASEVWLVGADGATVRLSRNIRLAVAPDHEVVLEQYYGRTLPTAHHGQARPLKVGVTASTWHAQGEVVDLSVLFGQPVHYRDPDGRAFWGVVSSGATGVSSDWARLAEVSLTVEATDYEP